MLDALAPFEPRLDGGWGVDALLGEQTRPHDDLDLLVALDDVQRLREVLAARGFRLTRGRPPTCFVLGDDRDRRVDVHPVVFDDHGDGHYTMENGEVWVCQAGGLAGRGVVAGRAVRCVTAEMQVRCHTGYPLREVDFHDMEALRRRFGVELLAEHRRPAAERRRAAGDR